MVADLSAVPSWIQSIIMYLFEGIFFSSAVQQAKRQKYYTCHGFPSLRNAKFVGGIYSWMTVMSLPPLCSDIISHQSDSNRAKHSLESLNMLYSASGEGWIYYMSNMILTLTAHMKSFPCANHIENVLGIFTRVGQVKWCHCGVRTRGTETYLYCIKINNIW